MAEQSRSIRADARRWGQTPRTSAARGFTIIEMFVVLGVVLLLLTILIVAIDGTRRSARVAADELTARSLSVAVQQFEDQFGFLPPLVNDGEPVSPPGIEPLIEEERGAARDVFLRVRTRSNEFLRGRVDDGDPDSVDPRDRDVVRYFDGQRFVDRRYSKLSLSYYLMGTLSARHPSTGEPVDGVEGPGFRSPSPDGQFARRGSPIDPLFTPRDSGRLQATYIDELEYREHGQPAPTSVTAGQDRSLDKTVLLDSFGRPFRYYRWNNDELVAADQQLGTFDNTPAILGDPLRWDSWRTEDWSPSADNPELRGARYAIVAGGENGLIGTELNADIDEALGNSPGLNDLTVRNRAWRDNIIEVGR